VPVTLADIASQLRNLVTVVVTVTEPVQSAEFRLPPFDTIRHLIPGLRCLVAFDHRDIESPRNLVEGPVKFPDLAGELIFTAKKRDKARRRQQSRIRRRVEFLVADMGRLVDPVPTDRFREHLNHYLEVLWRRPGALPGATALVQARASGRFRPEHQQFWDLARRHHGDSAGIRALCDVLLLHRYHHSDHVVAGIRAALSIGNTDPAVVTVETRRAIEHLQPAPAVGPVERVPDLSIYDQLLTIQPDQKGKPE
jgi:hypothetical protein